MRSFDHGSFRSEVLADSEDNAGETEALGGVICRLALITNITLRYS